MIYMSDTERKADDIISCVDYLKNSNNRRSNAELCDMCVDSMNELLECIEKIENIDLQKWVEDTSPRTASLNNSNIPELF